MTTAVTAAVALAVAVQPALAHGGAGGTREGLAVPSWLVVLTGGGVVGSSFLLSAFLADRALVDRIHAAGLGAPGPTRAATAAGRAVGLVGLAAVVSFGLVGPQSAANPAVVLVWSGWWAGLVASAYLVGDGWRAVNPARTFAGWLPGVDRTYPERFGAWPAVAGLLALSWVELASPVAADPRALAAAVVGYVLVSTLGAVWFGPADWFGRADPVARVFRYYGAVAPVERGEDGWRLRLPGEGVRDLEPAGPAGVAFAVALLWTTTFDGLVHTPVWNAVLERVVEWGMPPTAAYLGGLLCGFALFWGAYRVAVRQVRRRADSLLPRRELAGRFAVSLVPIAAGYHLAHFGEYVVAWLPGLVGALATPLSPGEVTAVAVPAWFGGVELLAVLTGHLLGVWVAHAVALESFPGRLQAVRSQYPLVAVMAAFTAVSLWVLAQPQTTPAYLGG